jgi:malate dehydrogenase (oxaloacetate-decarboxylating)(NADP+)
VAPAVAKAAMESGIAKNPIKDWAAYKENLRKRMGLSNPLKRQMKAAAKRNPKRIVLADAEHYNVLKAAEIVHNEHLAIPILLGDKEEITRIIKENSLELEGVKIIDPKSKAEAKRRKEFAEILFKKRQRRGITMSLALDYMNQNHYFAPMLVETGVADGMLAGMTKNYPTSIRPALQVIGPKTNTNIVSGMYIINTKEGPYFLADTTVNRLPSAEDLVEITLQTAQAVKNFNMEPVIAMVSYSNFGSVDGDSAARLQKAVSILHKEHPDLIVDGEMQANIALNQDIMKEMFPFSKLLGKRVNTLIFPNLASANISYKLIGELTKKKNELIGPVLNGMNKPVHILQMGSSVNEIVNMVMITVMDAQSRS